MKLNDVIRYQSLVGSDIIDELQTLAQDESESRWRAGDVGLRVIANFRTQREEGKFPGIAEQEVWAALGYFYGGKSGRRMRELSIVAGVFQPEERAKELEFGYYQKVLELPSDHWHSAIDFILGYINGEIITPGRKPNVDEVTFLYRHHILGMQVTDVPDPYAYEVHKFGPNEAPDRNYYSRASLQNILGISRTLRREIKEHTEITARFLDLLSQLEALIPAVIRELSVDKKETIDVQ